MTVDGPPVPGSAPGRPQFEVTFLPIGAYREHAPLDADGEARAIAALFDELDGTSDLWSAVPDIERTQTNVTARLSGWAGRGAERNSILIWLGHGETDGDRASLAVYESPAPIGASGVLPANLGGHITTEWRNRAGAETWTIVVIEACGAKRFVELLNVELFMQANGPERLAVIGVGGDGAGSLGEFRRALELTLASYNDNDDGIRMKDLVGRIEDRLGVGRVIQLSLHLAPRMARRRLLPGGLTAPVDVYAELQAYLSALPADERGHFVPKAQGAEQGELAWYFVGRQEERRELSAWLREATNGMLIVTGRAGAGKSALLGNLLVYTNPELRDLLVRTGQIDALPESEQPPDDPFDAVVHLTGVTTNELVRRLADAAGLGDLPAGGEFGHAAEWLVQSLRERDQGLTVLVDALDEAQEPATIAASVLRRIAALPHCRVIVGTRASTSEGPDRPDTADEDLLDSLRNGRNTKSVVVQRDQQAIAAYVRRRLGAAIQTGHLPTDAPIDLVADLMRRQDRQFLYARLAVHEILARPDLLLQYQRTQLVDLLGRDHRALFTTAVTRLTGESTVNYPLLAALAIAFGRGLPRADLVWATAATALSDDHATVTEADIDALLAAAAPYIMLDAEDGQSVYRLSHRTFQEHFVAGRDDHAVVMTDQALSDRACHGRVAQALIAIAQVDSSEPLNRYVQRYLAGHVAESERWGQLAEAPSVLDRLDPDGVAAELLRSAFGRADVPVEVAAVFAARHILSRTAPEDRPAVRAVAMARLTGAFTAAEPSGTSWGDTWKVQWARLNRNPVHAVLAGHTGDVYATTRIAMSDGRVLLATGGADGTARLWDAATGRPHGELMGAHRGGVYALAGVRLPNGRVLLATGGADGTARLWDTVTGRPYGEPLDAHQGGVYALAEVRLPDGRVLLATGGDDGTARFWDLHDRRACEMEISHGGAVHALAVMALPDGRIALATAAGGRNAAVRLWDASSGRSIGQPLAGHDGWVRALAPISLPDQSTLLATGGDDGTVRLWNPTDGQPVANWRLDHDAAVFAVASISLPDGRTLLATGGGRDSAIRLWNPTDGQLLAEPLTGHDGGVNSLTALSLPDGRTLLASAGGDGLARLWDPSVESLVSNASGGQTLHARAVTLAQLSDGQLALATAGATVHRWDLRGEVMQPSLAGRAGTMRAITVVRLADDREMLATGGWDGAMRLWDPYTGLPFGSPFIGHQRTVYSITPVLLPDDREMLATGGWDGTVRLWDPNTGQQLGATLTGHTGPVYAMTTVRMSDGRAILVTGGHDRTVRFWNPVTRQPAAEDVCFPGDVNALTEVTATGNGARLAIGGGNGTVRFWDPESARLIGEPLRGHINDVNAVEAVPLPGRSTLLATGGDDGTVRLWDTVTGQPLGHPLQVGMRVWGLANTPAGLAVAGNDGVLLVRMPIPPNYVVTTP